MSDLRIAPGPRMLRHHAIEASRAKPSAIMCAEGDFRRCHRQFLSDYLAANGIDVLHILPAGEARPHEMTPGIKIVDGTITYPGPPRLFDMDGP